MVSITSMQRTGEQMWNLTHFLVYLSVKNGCEKVTQGTSLYDARYTLWLAFADFCR